MWPTEAFDFTHTAKFSYIQLFARKKTFEWVKTYQVWHLDMPKIFGILADLKCAPLL